MNSNISSRERLERFQLHAAKCETFNSSKFESWSQYSIGSCLFRVVYETSNRSTFISAPEFAPLSYPAFIAGCPSAPDCLQMQILHCGGEVNHRDLTPYISCSQDLLWCMLSSAIALLQRTASNVQIWFIDNTRTHSDLQHEVWNEEHWDKLSRSLQNPDIDIAKKRATMSKEVLVYKEISRERVLGALNLDLETINQAPAEFAKWAQETLEKTWDYPTAVHKFFLNNPDDSDDLVEWCEYRIKRTSCVENISIVCAADAIYHALHPLSRDHIFVGPEVSYMKLDLHKIFEWGYGLGFWRLKYLDRHQDYHISYLDDDFIDVTSQKEEHQVIFNELMLDIRMEELNLDSWKMKEVTQYA